MQNKVCEVLIQFKQPYLFLSLVLGLTAEEFQHSTSQKSLNTQLHYLHLHLTVFWVIRKHLTIGKG